MTVLPQSDEYNATKVTADGWDGSPCMGDTGGPLFIRNRDNCGGVNYRQIGIISGGRRMPGRAWTECDGIAQFTRLSQFNVWIEETLRGSM